MLRCFEAHGLPHQRFEGPEGAGGGPDLQFRVARGADLQEEVVPPVLQLERGDDLVPLLDMPRPIAEEM